MDKKAIYRDLIEVTKSDADAPTLSALFVPQEWMNDIAHEVRVPDSNEVSFEVPLHEALEIFQQTDPDLAFFDPENGHILPEGSYETDALTGHPSAPGWVLDWNGPFEVEIENAFEVEAWINVKLEGGDPSIGI